VRQPVYCKFVSANVTDERLDSAEAYESEVSGGEPRAYDSHCITQVHESLCSGTVCLDNVFHCRPDEWFRAVSSMTRYTTFSWVSPTPCISSLQPRRGSWIILG
jgi:hypothetical protein